MAQDVLFGTDASVTFPSGAGGLFNSWSIAITQGIARAVGFGDTWQRSRGTVLSYSGTIGGHVTKGTANDKPGISAVMTRGGADTTLTSFTGCTLAGTFVFTGTSISADYTGNQIMGYALEGDGELVETWVTT
jgi:hypothetical protein